jgi:DNA-binding PadR family transcriptional regulator
MQGIDARRLDYTITRGPLASAVLGSLATQPRRGYEILRFVGNEAVAMGVPLRKVESTVYPLLETFIEQGIIETDGRARTRASALYSITPGGIEVLSARARESPFESRRLAFEALYGTHVAGRASFVTPRERFEAATTAFQSRLYARSLRGGDLDIMPTQDASWPTDEGIREHDADSARPARSLGDG